MKTLLLILLLFVPTAFTQTWDTARYPFVGTDEAGSRYVIDLLSFKRIKNSHVVGFTLWTRDTELRVAGDCFTTFAIAKSRDGDGEENTYSGTPEFGTPIYNGIIKACSYRPPVRRVTKPKSPPVRTIKI